ncbi:hypothetical protein ECH_0868 [Ehrlichia chaffeensis str. Arkansas]|uniref:Lipoprotein n=1 Tax=Ehrlichia chaffeensis (strain ATCC CRL-10679 / Arkansas) TaxID=205920 RepID=Q2GFX0_EHRCR|nr:hypothetical protein ECH_0868 [Ehrlichia chaffeensis str. Arkansas]
MSSFFENVAVYRCSVNNLDVSIYLNKFNHFY